MPKGAHGTGQSVGVAGGEAEAVKARLHRRTHIAQTAGQHRGAQSVGLGGDKGEALVAKAGGNNGAAFGMHIASKGGFDWGKLLLGIFRIVMVGLIGWLMHHLLRRREDTPKGVIVGLALVMAGALGNIIDSAFYGLIFSESTPYAVAHFGGHYAGFMMGKVVDMFYFPLFQWNNVPRFLSFLVDSNNYFFGAIFNLADAYISVAVVYLLLFQYKFLSK